MSRERYEFDARIQAAPDMDAAYVIFPWDLREEFGRGRGRVKVHAEFDGTPYDAAEATMALPRFVNDAEAVADQFLQAQARLLFGADE